MECFFLSLTNLASVKSESKRVFAGRLNLLLKCNNSESSGGPGCLNCESGRLAPMIFAENPKDILIDCRNLPNFLFKTNLLDYADF
jgi:hypothetical protein